MGKRLNMSVLTRIAQGLFIACLPFFFFTASIAWAANSLWLYTSGFEKQGVSATTGLDAQELEKVARGLIGYWNSGDDEINLTVLKDGKPFQLFNEREISHLKDVKALFRLDYGVLLGTLLYVLGYALTCLLWRRRRYWRRLARGVAAGSAVTLGLMLATAAGALLGEEQFARFWLQFHIFSFANDLWLLDPTKDYLVMLVPQGFWYDAVRFITFATAGMAVVLGGAAAGHLLFNRSAQEE